MALPSHPELRRHVGYSGVNGYDQPRIWCLHCAQGTVKVYDDEPGLEEARCWCCRESLLDVAAMEANGA